MPWFKVDDTFPHHAKVLAAGNAAVGLWTRAGAWCMQQLTDGYVPQHVARTLGTPSEAKKLVDVGLWLRVDGGYEFHQWQDRQPSREKVEAERHAAAERQRHARERAKSRRESQRDEGVSHGPPDPTRPDPTHNSGANAPDESAAEPRDDAKTPALVEAPRPDVDRICDHLADRVEANGSKRPAITGKWRDAARLMLDRDGRTEQEVHGAIDWCQRDEFWRSNVLSLPKLREKYDTLRLQAQRQQPAQTQSRAQGWLDLARDLEAGGQ